MPKRIPSGVISPTPDGTVYSVIEYGQKKATHEATGVFISGHPGQLCTLEYAGVNKPLGGFQLPRSTKHLRDVAEALIMLADETDKLRGGPT